MTIKRARSKTIKGPIRHLRRWILCLLILASSQMMAYSQSELFSSLKETHDIEAELYFYASTLRMINLANNPDFDEMVKDIDKIRFFKIRGLDRKEVRQLASRFLTEEEFDELLTLDSRDERVYLMGANNDEFIALVETDQDLLAVNLEGLIGVHKIPELINSLNSDDFLNVFEVGKSERKEHQQDRRNN